MHWAMLAVLVLMSLVSAGIVAGLGGGVSRTLHFHGPFQTEGNGSRLVSVPLPDDHRLSCCVLVVDDSGPRGGEASRLQLWVNGVELGPPHTPQAAIRQGGSGFSHWGKHVFFALPAGVQNGSATQVTVRYPYWFGLRTAIIPVATLALAMAMAALALIRRGVEPRRILLSLGGNVALAVCALLTVALIALRLAPPHIDQTFTGPFWSEPTSQLKAIDPRPLGALTCCLTIPSDGKSDASRLRFWLNGVEILPAHTPHAEIRAGHGGFSHWNGHVYFALPQGTDNSGQTQARLDSPLAPAAWTLLFPAMTLGLLIGLHGRRTSAWIKRQSAGDFAVLGANVVMAIGALATVGLIALSLAPPHVDQSFTGPFSGEPTSQLKSITPRPLGAMGCCLRIPFDGRGETSRLRFWINGVEILPAHTLHDEIRAGHRGFSHWDGSVLFALPNGTSNSGQTTARLDSPLAPAAWTLLFPAVTLALFIGLYGRRTLAWMKSQSAAVSVLIKSPYLVLALFGWVSLAAGVAYLATMLWGLVTGEALVLAIPFRSEQGKAVADALDAAIPPSLLALAVFGVAAGWLAARLPAKHDLREAEVSGIRWIRRYGLFCLAMVYLASVGATWAGTWRSRPDMTVLGLVPIFDTSGYFSDTHTFLHDGRMGPILSRRPLHGALRLVTMGISGFRFNLVLFWQALALAGSTFFATLAIMRWRGIWAGVVFVALAYIAIRPHLPTLASEPVGLMVGIAALGFLAEALRTSSKGHALLGIALLTAALWIRPGAMFIIPGLALWFAWSFHETLQRQLRGFAIACVPIIAVIAVNTLLKAFFAGPAFEGGLWYSICGLSLGGDWTACLTAYPKEYMKVSGNIGGETAWLASKAIYNIQHDPGTFIRTLAHEPIRFWEDLPHLLFQGYSSAPIPDAFPWRLWLLTVPVFGALSLRTRNLRAEAPFWVVVCLGLSVSALVVYPSDGARAMAVTYPLIGLFIAAVFSSPATQPIPCAQTARREVRLGAILTVAGTAGLFAFLPLIRLIYPSPEASLPPGESQGNAAIVGNLAQSAGVLVVADDQPLPHGVPSVHLSRFAEVLHLSNFQGSQGIIEPKSPPLPFGFIDMPSLTWPGARILITPPEMVTRRDVRAWHIVFEDWNPSGQVNAHNWDHVVSATPYVGPIRK